jgi:hypothetical protein
MLTRGRDRTTLSARLDLLAQAGFSTQQMQDSLVACLNDAFDKGLTADACMLQALSQQQGGAGTKREDYFVYEKTPAAKNRQFIDACEVYTGPTALLRAAADVGSSDVEDASAQFERCLASQNATSSSCNIPSFVWSGRSSNRVPVANFHAYADPDPVASAIQAHQKISAHMLDILHEVNRSFSSDGLDAMLFSTEGDALHQMFDCVFMGPYASMDYGARGLFGDLPVPFYSRQPAGVDATTGLPSRAFDLPCDASKMKGDFKGPFTCGSPLRRAVIKYFVRDYANINQASCTQSDAGLLNATARDVNVQRIVNLVKQKLAKLMVDWQRPEMFGCPEPNGGVGIGPQFCTADAWKDWTPDFLQNWGHVDTAEVAQEVLGSVPCFFRETMVNPNVAYKYLDPDEKQRYRWMENEQHAFAAQESALFHTHRPVVSYGSDELGEPLQRGDASLWLMCAGMLGNVFFTLPLRQNDQGQYVLSTMTEQSGTTSTTQTSSSSSTPSPAAGYSVYGTSSTPGITALEDFVQRASRDALLTSPFYRHYAMHHLPSDSGGCPDVAKEAERTLNPVRNGSFYTFRSDLPLPPKHLANISIPRKGFLSGLLGTPSCFCDFNNAAVVGTAAAAAVPEEQQQQLPCQLPEVITKYILVNFFPATTPSVNDDLDVQRVWDLVDKQQGFFRPTDNPLLHRVLAQHWLPEVWPCPELDVSDHWGFVRNGSAWTQSNESSTLLANDYLERGYGGLRAGTVQHVLEEARRILTPQNRLPVQDGAPLTGHTRCERNRASMRPESLADRFIHDLFPAAQAVVDSPAISYCMRYAIELARSHVVALLTQTEAVSAERIRTSLSGTVTAWRHRCKAQIDLLGVCSLTQALKVNLDPYVFLKPEHHPSHCPFRLRLSGNPPGYFVDGTTITPGCLIYKRDLPTDKVYDPCRVLACGHGAANSLLLLDPSTDLTTDMELPYNPMHMVDDLDVRGTWPPYAAASDPPEYEAAAAAEAARWRNDDSREELPSRLASVDLLRRALLEQEQGTGVGSPNSFPGAANVGTATEQTGTRHCDMVQVRG